MIRVVFTVIASAFFGLLVPHTAAHMDLVLTPTTLSALSGFIGYMGGLSAELVVRIGCYYYHLKIS